VLEFALTNSGRNYPGESALLTMFHGGTLVVHISANLHGQIPICAYPALIRRRFAAKKVPQTPRPLPHHRREFSVKFLKPNDPLLNTPNKITQDI